MVLQPPEFQRKLMYVGYDKLDLIGLDRLRNEVDMKIQAINLEHKQQSK